MKPEPTRGPACWALTSDGAELARRIAAQLDGTVHVPVRFACASEHGFESLAVAVAEHWELVKQHVFIAAAGIVVRTIAPYVRTKTDDPAVVVCDQAGQYAISLLSGHLGGANHLAARVAACCGAQAVITTATDTAGLPAFDLLAVQADCAFADLRELRSISAGLLEGLPLTVWDPLGVLDRSTLEACPLCQLMPLEAKPPLLARSTAQAALLHSQTVLRASSLEVVVSLSTVAPRPGRLRLHPRRLWAGIGCRRGATAVEIANALSTVFTVSGLAPQALAGCASAAIKCDELGLHEAARQCNVPLSFFSAEELARVPVPHPSTYAAQALGVARVGVCEAAALLAAGEGARLLVPKQILGATPSAGTRVGRVTVALASCLGSAADIMEKVCE